MRTSRPSHLALSAVLSPASPPESPVTSPRSDNGSEGGSDCIVVSEEKDSDVAGHAVCITYAHERPTDARREAQRSNAESGAGSSEGNFDKQGTVSPISKSENSDVSANSREGLSSGSDTQTSFITDKANRSDFTSRYPDSHKPEKRGPSPALAPSTTKPSVGDSGSPFEPTLAKERKFDGSARAVSVNTSWMPQGGQGIKSIVSGGTEDELNGHGLPEERHTLRHASLSIAQQSITKNGQQREGRDAQARNAFLSDREYSSERAPVFRSGAGQEDGAILNKETTAFLRPLSHLQTSESSSRGPQMKPLSDSTAAGNLLAPVGSQPKSSHHISESSSRMGPSFPPSLAVPMPYREFNNSVTKGLSIPGGKDLLPNATSRTYVGQESVILAPPSILGRSSLRKPSGQEYTGSSGTIERRHEDVKTEHKTAAPSERPVKGEQKLLPALEIDEGLNASQNWWAETSPRSPSPSGEEKRKGKNTLPPSAVNYLKNWMMSPDHIDHPYPTDAQKQEIMRATGLQLKQLTNWFTNNRKRYWKPRVEALEYNRQSTGPVAEEGDPTGQEDKTEEDEAGGSYGAKKVLASPRSPKKPSPRAKKSPKDPASVKLKAEGTLEGESTSSEGDMKKEGVVESPKGKTKVKGRKKGKAPSVGISSVVVSRDKSSKNPTTFEGQPKSSKAKKSATCKENGAGWKLGSDTLRGKFIDDISDSDSEHAFNATERLAVEEFMAKVTGMGGRRVPYALNINVAAPISRDSISRHIRKRSGGLSLHHYWQGAVDLGMKEDLHPSGSESYESDTWSEGSDFSNQAANEDERIFWREFHRLHNTWTRGEASSHRDRLADGKKSRKMRRKSSRNDLSRTDDVLQGKVDERSPRKKARRSFRPFVSSMAGASGPGHKRRLAGRPSDHYIKRAGVNQWKAALTEGKLPSFTEATFLLAGAFADSLRWEGRDQRKDLLTRAKERTKILKEMLSKSGSPSKCPYRAAEGEESSTEESSSDWYDDEYYDAFPAPSSPRNTAGSPRSAGSRSPRMSIDIKDPSSVSDVSGKTKNSSTSVLDPANIIENKMEDGSVGESLKRHEVWVQCDKCEKWRRLPDFVDADSLPAKWFCKMNQWDSVRNSCEAAEEDYKTPAAKPRDGVYSDIRARRAVKDLCRRLKITDKVEKKYRATDRPVALPEGVVEWIRCCNPHCGKYRALPTTIDATLLPEEWYCVMNTWDESHSSCGAPQEEGWDKKDPGFFGRPQTKKKRKKTRAPHIISSIVDDSGLNQDILESATRRIKPLLAKEEPLPVVPKSKKAVEKMLKSKAEGKKRKTADHGSATGVKSAKASKSKKQKVAANYALDPRAATAFPAFASPEMAAIAGNWLPSQYVGGKKTGKKGAAAMMEGPPMYMEGMHFTDGALAFSMPKSFGFAVPPVKAKTKVKTAAKGKGKGKTKTKTKEAKSRTKGGTQASKAKKKKAVAQKSKAKGKGKATKSKHASKK